MQFLGQKFLDVRGKRLKKKKRFVNGHAIYLSSKPPILAVQPAWTFFSVILFPVCRLSDLSPRSADDLSLVFTEITLRIWCLSIYPFVTCQLNGTHAATIHSRYSSRHLTKQRQKRRHDFSFLSPIYKLEGILSFLRINYITENVTSTRRLSPRVYYRSHKKLQHRQNRFRQSSVSWTPLVKLGTHAGIIDVLRSRTTASSHLDFIDISFIDNYGLRRIEDNDVKGVNRTNGQVKRRKLLRETIEYYNVCVSIVAGVRLCIFVATMKLAM